MARENLQLPPIRESMRRSLNSGRRRLYLGDGYPVIYLALTCWFLFAVMIARGILRIWSGMVQPKVLNVLLLPGTLVAQLGHVLGLLVTGATVTNTTLFKNDETGDPETTLNPKPRIPIIGPVIIGLLPLVACVAAIVLIAGYWGGPFVGHVEPPVVVPAIPTTLSAVWQLLRDQITLMESLAATIAASNTRSWTVWLFLYLLVCFSVRMAPFPGNVRGALGAIVVLGLGAALVASLIDVGDPRIQSGWAIMNLTVAALLLLLAISLVIRGVVGIVQLLRSNG